jgi:Aromatic-ring-opening dioxygenase LigAB, LigA subunit
MSIYFVHKLCKEARRDPEFRERLKSDPEAALAGYRFNDEERKALFEGDIAKLLQLGAHGYALGSLARLQLFGLTPEIYTQRKDAVKRD